MNTKHTPGPWIAQPGDNFITDDRDIVICEMHRHHADDQVNANARLIAVAPELMNVARLLVTANCSEAIAFATQRAHAAIAKATRGQA